jgi:hypothetical protein
MSMDATMSGINDEMRVTADYAISIAKERYGLELDYSEESLGVLDNILEKIYWGFSGHTKDEGEGGLIYNSAIIWGSYLGEYMRLKWGGTWLMKGTERRVSITTIEFSPINFIFQRITTHPEYSVKNFIQETKNVIYASVIHPQKPQYVPEPASKPKEPAPVQPAKKPFVIDKRVIYITGGILGILIVVTACMAGYTVISQRGLPAIGFLAKITSTQTFAPSSTVQASATLHVTSQNTPTMTQLPTYTPVPTRTPRPSRTPLFTLTGAPTGTPTETFTPTGTETEYIPPTQTASSTPTLKNPTKTRTPTPATIISPSKTPTPTLEPSPTNTREPTPTFTEVPPRVVSCSVNPSTVPPGVPTILTFKVKFSAPGYSITGMDFSPNPPGSQGCTATDDDGDGVASCSGSSGLLSSGDQINVTIQTSLGDCSVSFGS